MLDAMVYDLPIVTARRLDVQPPQRRDARHDGLTATVCKSIEQCVELVVGLARDLVWRAKVKRMIPASARPIETGPVLRRFLEEFSTRSRTAQPK
jgi:hypothetical protein